MTQKMNHFLIVTDTNSRQYLFKVEEAGVPVTTATSDIVVTIENPNLQFFIECLDMSSTFVINGSDVFNSVHLVAVQLKAFPADEIG